MKTVHQCAKFVVVIGAWLAIAPVPVLATPVVSWASVYWAAPVTSEIFIDPMTIYIRQLSYQVGGSGPSFDFVPGGSQLLDNSSQSLQLVGVNKPYPAIKPVPGKPDAYASDGPYTFDFVSPIPPATTKVQFGGGVQGAPPEALRIGISGATMKYESLDGSVRNYRLAIDPVQIDFWVSPTLNGAENDPDFAFTVSNPGGTSVHVASLRYLVSDSALPEEMPIGTESGFKSFSSRFGAGSDSLDLSPDSQSGPFGFLGLSLGSWLYVEGTVAQSGGPEASFRYGYTIRAVPETNTLALIGLGGFAGVWLGRGHPKRKGPPITRVRLSTRSRNDARPSVAGSRRAA
ncbi:MAG: hypothetical protein GC151_03855 [Betaproteobacteria bacterium]|nr:hypothetical protein [Betaproteobacteria bacterium]